MNRPCTSYPGKRFAAHLLIFLFALVPFWASVGQTRIQVRSEDGRTLYPYRTFSIRLGDILLQSEYGEIFLGGDKDRGIAFEETVGSGGVDGDADWLSTMSHTEPFIITPTTTVHLYRSCFAARVLPPSPPGDTNRTSVDSCTWQLELRNAGTNELIALLDTITLLPTPIPPGKGSPPRSNLARKNEAHAVPNEHDGFLFRMSDYLPAGFDDAVYLGIRVRTNEAYAKRCHIATYHSSDIQSLGSIGAKCTGGVNVHTRETIK